MVHLIFGKTVCVYIKKKIEFVCRILDGQVNKNKEVRNFYLQFGWFVQKLDTKILSSRVKDENC